MFISPTATLTSSLRFILLALGASGVTFFIALSVANAQSATVTLELEKKFSGPVPAGYTADQFYFLVNGNGYSDEVVTLSAHTNDSAKGTIDVPAGTYTIEEVGPADFVPGEWRPGWYGLCEAGTDFSTSITISDNDLSKGVIPCQVDNQWRFGTLNVVKKFIGTTTDPSNFSFTVTQGSLTKYDGAFESDGSNEVVMGEGDFTVTEYPYTDYTATYFGACDSSGKGTFGFEDTGTCYITNTYNGTTTATTTPDIYGCTNPTANNYNVLATIDDGSCTFDTAGPTWLVFGYVWHDANTNELWDGVDTATTSTSTEDDLTGWTVTISNGTTSYATTTDADGYYQFYVPAGTWTIYETLMDGWTKTYPSNEHSVIVVDESQAVRAQTTWLASLLNSIIPVAHAQTATTYGPFNFGNVYNGQGDDNGDGDGGDDDDNHDHNGGSSGPSCDLFTASVANFLIGDTLTLTWETTRGDDIEITENGTTILSTTTDDGAYDVTPTNNTTYDLTVSRGSRTDSCALTVTAFGGTGGGSDVGTPQILGEQVSVVPVGAPNAGGGGATPVEIPRITIPVPVLTSGRRLHG